MRFICLLPVWVTLVLFPLLSIGQRRPPVFADYPAAARYRGAQVAPKLRPNTAAWQFRTRIREAAQRAPNFAGHYVVAMWGCGIECLGSAIIDVKTGQVWCNDLTVCCWAAQQPDDFEPINFRLNSRLLIYNGQLGDAGPNGAHYYTFGHGQLNAVR